MDLKVQSESIFWEQFLKRNRKQANWDLLFLMELRIDLSWIDKIQKVTILSTWFELYYINQTEQLTRKRFFGNWLNVKLN